MSMIERWILFLVAVVIQSSGITLVVKSLLGTSPISSLPYVMSFTFPFTLGETTFAVNMLFVAGQFLILKKKFTLLHAMQIPATMIFAYFIDVFMNVFQWVTPEFYGWKMLVLLVGASLVSLGVSLQGIADVLKLPGDGIVYVISDTYHFDFGKVKTTNDVLLVSLALLLSYLAMGDIEGVREGTVISALITGGIARFFLLHLSTWKDGRRVLRISF